MIQRTHGVGRVAVSVQAGIFLIAVVVLEIRRRMKMKIEVPFELAAITISSREFEERILQGEELVILEGLILDISDFKADHPGG